MILIEFNNNLINFPRSFRLPPIETPNMPIGGNFEELVRFCETLRVRALIEEPGSLARFIGWENEKKVASVGLRRK
jgi:hypothetical protein